MRLQRRWGKSHLQHTPLKLPDISGFSMRQAGEEILSLCQPPPAHLQAKHGKPAPASSGELWVGCPPHHPVQGRVPPRRCRLSHAPPSEAAIAADCGSAEAAHVPPRACRGSCQAGARVATDVLLRDLNLNVPVRGSRSSRRSPLMSRWYLPCHGTELSGEDEEPPGPACDNIQARDAGSSLWSMTVQGCTLPSPGHVAPLAWVLFERRPICKGEPARRHKAGVLQGSGGSARFCSLGDDCEECF